MALEVSTAQFSLEANAQFQRHGRMDVSPSATELIVVSAKDSYRHLARTLPTADDAVLEIGCATGEATRGLLTTGARVAAVDKAARAVARLEEALREHGDVVVACLDGRNIPALAALMPSPTVVFIDLGGDAHLDTIALQLRLCLRAFVPRLVVVRNFELATLASLIGQVEPPLLSGLLPAARPLGRDRLTNLLDLSASTSTDTRCFAARRLGTLPTALARDRLQEMLADPHPSVRRAAARACQPDGPGRAARGSVETRFDPIHAAARARDADRVRRLLSEGVEVDGLNGQAPNGDGGNTALWFACQGPVPGGLEVARLLVEAGADVNRPGEHGYTPLHMAAQWGHLDVVAFLAGKGAVVDALADLDGTPLDMARARGHQHVVTHLVGLGGGSARPAEDAG